MDLTVYHLWNTSGQIRDAQTRQRSTLPVRKIKINRFLIEQLKSYATLNTFSEFTILFSLQLKKKKLIKYYQYFQV